MKYIYVAVNPADLAWSSHCVFFLFGTNVSSLYIVQAVLLDIRQRDRFLKSFFSGGRFFSHLWISKKSTFVFLFFLCNRNDPWFASFMPKSTQAPGFLLVDNEWQKIRPQRMTLLTPLTADWTEIDLVWLSLSRRQQAPLFVSEVCGITQVDIQFQPITSILVTNSAGRCSGIP